MGGREVLQEWTTCRADVARFKHSLLPEALLFIAPSKIPPLRLDQFFALLMAYSYCHSVWTCRRPVTEGMLADMEGVAQYVLRPLFLTFWPEKLPEAALSGPKIHNLLVRLHALQFSLKI